MRRQYWLGGAGVFFVMATMAPACSQHPQSLEQPGGDNANISFGKVPTPPEWNEPVARNADEATAASQRGSCTFQRGSMPGESIGAEIPVTESVDNKGVTDNNIPIQNIVVLMQENRSFDSYFGHLNAYRIANGFANTSEIEAPPEDTSVPATLNDSDNDAPREAWQHADALCFPSTNHEWFGAHYEWDYGANDGFYEANNGYTDDCWAPPYPCATTVHDLPPELLDGERAMWWYDDRDIPFYYELASKFAIGDHYHSSVLGPTWTNRDYLYGATSLGTTTNVYPDLTGRDFPNGMDTLIFDELERRHVTWKIYMDGAFPGVGTFIKLPFTRWNILAPHFHTTSTFFADAKAGKLPQVAFIDPRLLFENDPKLLGITLPLGQFNNDEHPPGDIQRGQDLVSRVVHALMGSPQWSQLAFFLTWDENGGIYDHVAPPPACAPDDIAPILVTAADQATGPADGFARYGFRVPFVVMSPYVKPNYVSHHLYDHTSIVRFIEAKFKIPALSARDANADPLFDFFDFGNPAFMTPPDIADAVVDPDALQSCNATYFL